MSDYPLYKLKAVAQRVLDLIEDNRASPQYLADGVSLAVELLFPQDNVAEVHAAVQLRTSKFSYTGALNTWSNQHRSADVLELLNRIIAEKE